MTYRNFENFSEDVFNQELRTDGKDVLKIIHILKKFS